MDCPRSQTNMARQRLVFTFVTLYFFCEFSQCSADNEDSFAWNVKDSTEFGVAESNIEVNALILYSLYPEFIQVISFINLLIYNSANR